MGRGAGWASAEATGMTPATPPKAPSGTGREVGTAAPPAPPRLRVLARELATPGRGASEAAEEEAAAVVEAAAAGTEVAETGGRSEFDYAETGMRGDSPASAAVVDAAAVGVSRMGRTAREDDSRPGRG